MQDAAEGLVGKHDYRVSLEVWMKFLSGTSQGQGSLLYLRISYLCIGHCSANIINRLLLIVCRATKHNSANCLIRYNQIHVQLFSRLRAVQDGWLCEVVFNLLKGALTVIRPSNHISFP